MQSLWSPQTQPQNASEFHELLHRARALTNADRVRISELLMRPQTPSLPHILDLNDLPYDSVLEIMSLLDPQSIARIAGTKKMFRGIAAEFSNDHEYDLMHPVVQRWRRTEASWAPIASIDKKTLFVRNNKLMQRDYPERGDGDDSWVYKLHVLLQSHGIRLAGTTVDLLAHHSRVNKNALPLR